MITNTIASFLTYAALASARPLLAARTVSSLDQAAFDEAQQRDDTATRAFSNVQIKTSDGRCLFVDELSGDFRANLTPVQVADCGSTSGEGWDVITAGKHINVAGSMLVVSTLTNACFNFDPRRAAGNQVNLFSCGGRADGGGDVTNSQLFTFEGGAGPLSFEPENQQGSCLTVKGNVVDVADCDSNDANQSFTFGGAAASNNSGTASGSATSAAASSTAESAPETTRATDTAATTSTATSELTSAATSAAAATPDASGGIPNPTEPVPVSRAGGQLEPSAAAEANARDATATRAFSSVEIRGPSGQCLFVDPTAGDFRENLIPVALVDCGGTPNEKWDVITAGKHNSQPGTALVVSSLMQGCISFDGRRAQGDTVVMDSCGGRADGSGETNSGQVFPFVGQLSFALAPASEGNKTCILPGDAGRLDSGPCPTNGDQLFSIFP